MFGSFWSGIKAVPLTDEGTVLAGADPIALARRPEPPGAVEAAFLHPHGGHFYLFVSFDACCRGKRSTYHIRAGRSETFLGPYLDREARPLLDGDGTLILAPSERDIGPGHNSLLVDGGQEYLVYNARYGGAARLRIQALTWVDGWPEVGASKATTSPQR